MKDEGVIKSLPSIQIPDAKPCVLTRELKANALEFQEPARVSNGFDSMLYMGILNKNSLLEVRTCSY